MKHQIVFRSLPEKVLIFWPRKTIEGWAFCRYVWLVKEWIAIPGNAMEWIPLYYKNKPIIEDDRILK